MPDSWCWRLQDRMLPAQGGPGQGGSSGLGVSARGCGELAVLTCVCPPCPPQCCQTLLSHRVDPALRDEDGYTAAELAEYHGHRDCAQYLRDSTRPVSRAAPSLPAPLRGAHPAGLPVVGREEGRAWSQGYKGDQGWAAAGAPRRSARLAGHRAHAHTQARRLGRAEDTRGWEWGPSRVLGGVTPGGGPALCSPEGTVSGGLPAGHVTSPSLASARAGTPCAGPQPVPGRVSAE